MAFPRQPHPRIRRWDKGATEAAIVLQLLYMGGKAQWPTDTTKFDQLIKRPPGGYIFNGEYIRVLHRLLPSLHTSSFGPTTNMDCDDPQKMAKRQQAAGWDKAQIAEYLASELYRNHQARIRDIRAASKKLGERYKFLICTDSRTRTLRLLTQGAVVVVTGGDGPCLLSNLRNGEVQAFYPAYGARTVHLQTLEDGGDIDLHDGGVAYTMA